MRGYLRVVSAIGLCVFLESVPSSSGAFRFFLAPAANSASTPQNDPDVPKITKVEKTNLISSSLRNELTQLKPKITILIVGGLGLLSERFLKEAFQGLRGELPFQVEFIVADVWPDSDERKKRMDTIGLPWREGNHYFQLSKNPQDLQKDERFLKNGTVRIDGEDIQIDAAILAVPTVAHLAIAQVLTEKGIPVWLDKPIAMIDQVAQVVELAQQRPRHVFAVDFFVDADPFVWVLKEGKEFFSKIGKIKRMSGRCVESWDVAREPRKWLLEPSVSGGGLGIDTAVHPLAMIAALLRNLKLSLDDIKIRDVRLGRYSEPQEGESLVETYFWMQGYVGDIEILVDGGKGIDTTYYGITLQGEKGELEIFVGTEEYDPYVRLKVFGREEVLYRFLDGRLGYGRTFLDFFLFLAGSEKTSGLSRQVRLEASAASVNAVGKASEFTSQNRLPIKYHPFQKAPSVPIQVQGQVHSSMPQTKQKVWTQPSAAENFEKQL